MGIEDATLQEAVPTGKRAFFIYGFSKSRQANISSDEEMQFKEAAKHVLSLTETHLAELVKRGDFVEVKPNEKKISK